MVTRWRLQGSSEPQWRQSETSPSAMHYKKFRVSRTFEHWSKNMLFQKQNSELISTRVCRKGVFLWIFTLCIAFCILGSSITDAKPMCGGRLVDALTEFCGERGISRPVLGAHRGGRRVAQGPPDIIKICCRKGCTMEQLSQYCGGGKNAHYINVLASMKRDPSRRRQQRPRPATSKRSVTDERLRDDDRAPTRTASPTGRQTRRHVTQRNRYLNMNLQEFLIQHAESYVSEHAENGTDSNDVLLQLSRSYLRNRTAES